MINKIKEIIEKFSTLDVDGNIKYVDVLDYDKLANELLPAINYTLCCTELKVVDSEYVFIDKMIDKEAMSAEWRRQNL